MIINKNISLFTTTVIVQIYNSISVKNVTTGCSRAKTSGVNLRPNYG